MGVPPQAPKLTPAEPVTHHASLVTHLARCFPSGRRSQSSANSTRHVRTTFLFTYVRYPFYIRPLLVDVWRQDAWL